MARRAEAQEGRGQTETYLLITRLIGWDLDVLPGLADDHRGSPGPDRGEGFLIISACRLTCGYDTGNLC